MAEAGRQVALGARGLATGAVALPALGADVLGHILNLGVKAYNASTGSSIPEFPAQGPALEKALSAAGVPAPETAGERVAYDVNRAAGGAATTMGAAGLSAPASAVGQGVRSALIANPGMQSAAAVSGAAASGATREAGGGPGAQLVAGMAGSLAPTVARDSLAATTRLAFRGGKEGQQAMQGNIKTFEDAGTVPTVGQATEGRIAQAGESLLSKVPGGAGRMAAKAEAQQAQIGSKIDQLANTLSPRSDATSAGRQVGKGVEGFVSKFKAKGGSLYDDVDTFIAPDVPVPVTITSATLAKLTTQAQGAPTVSKLLVNPRVKAVADALQTDAPQGQLPYDSLKKLRTMIGEQLTSSELISDMPKTQLKQIYGAITRDMQTAAQTAGPNAVKALNRANSYWRAGMDRVDQLDRVVNKIDFESIYKAATSGTREGATNLRAVMRSVPEEARDAVTATFIKKMGQSLPGKAVDEGSFSTESFLTNWNKLSPEAKMQLFNKDDLRKGLDSIAKVAGNIRSGSKVFANPSGTGPAIALSSGAGGAVLAALLGRPEVAGGIVAGMGVANASARLMSNPTFVKWLASDLRRPREQIPAQIQALIRAESEPSK